MIGPAAKGLFLLFAFGANGPIPTLPPAAALAAQGGVIEGIVYDSTAARPLVGARVFLWNTSMFAETDELGHFQIEDVPTGSYDLVFFHPRLTDLGVSSGRTPVEVQPNERVTVALSTPSMMTIMSLLCMAEDPMGESARAIGYVGDASTHVPLPGAQIIMTWEEDSPTGKHLATKQGNADSGGWYSVCDVPPDVEVEATAYFMGQAAETHRFRLEAGVPTRVDFRFGAAEPGSLAGVLRDADDGHGIGDAVVRLAGADIETLTDPQGHFLLDEVPSGSYELSVSHLAYENRIEPLFVAPNQRVDVELELATQPIELAPMTVVVKSAEEVQALAMGGRLVSRAQIDEVRYQARDTGDLLSRTNTPGLVVSRAGSHMCVGFRRGQVTMQRGSCQPAMVYINDVPASDPTIAMNLSPDVIDRMVLVPPVEAGVLFNTGSAAGVILIYTRAR